MTTLREILQEQTLPGHCFSPAYYIRPDIHTGLLASRGGYRLAAFPMPLLEALYSGLRYETGQAARVILYNCGRDWGEEFFRRFEDELSRYHNQPLRELPMGILLDALSDLWATHGWGRLELDFSAGNQGLVQATVRNSGFALAARASLRPEDSSAPREPAGYLESGVLASLFSLLSGRDLICVQTTCESLGADQNRFLIGTAQRLHNCEEWVRKGLSHDEILDRLTATPEGSR
ncbi:MAG: V4R domain-containing protein [Thermostichus sp. HHBFW_bins_43]